MSSLSLKKVEKIYPGGVQAIQSMNFDIKDGEFIVLVGPSGCGKSTMLRLIAGLEEISKGEIYIDDELVNDKEPADRDIAMVFQNYALYPHMTVYENMAYGLKNRKIKKERINELVNEVAKTLELSDLLLRKPKALSGGQRQRVAMGRAIVREPKVFLFDEPLSNLDAKLRVQMRLEIKQLQERLGVTSIYVTHDQIEAMTLGQRLVLMEKGRIEQIGTPIEVYEYPSSIFVASFIGSPPMNLVKGKMIRESELELDGGLVVKSESFKDFDIDKQITIGVRPEHIVLNNKAECLIKVNTHNFERQGADSFIYGTVLNGEDKIIARVPHDYDYKNHETIDFYFDYTNMHCFDSNTGLRL